MTTLINIHKESATLLAIFHIYQDCTGFGSGSGKSGIQPFLQKSGQVRLWPNFQPGLADTSAAAVRSFINNYE